MSKLSKLSYETVEAVAKVDDKAANLEKFLVRQRIKAVFSLFAYGAIIFVGVFAGVGLSRLLF